LLFRTENERRHVRHAFSRYLAPSVVEQLANNPERLVLGGEERELTVMFSDIRGFTTIAEGFDAHGLTNFLIVT
jgi:adenylate cyclase